MKRLGLVLVLGMSLLRPAAASVQAGGPAELLLEEARKKETVSGDLEGAIRIYREVVAKHAGNRPAVARALVRIGQCYEKLGSNEARKAYERVVREFGDQQAASEARARLSALGTATLGGTGITMTQLPFGLDNDVGRVSPDGRYYAFADWETTGDLTVRDLQTTRHSKLTTLGWPKSREQIHSLDWCGNSGQILYALTRRLEGDGGELRSVRADGTGARTVLRLEGSEQLGIFSCSGDGGKALVGYYKDSLPLRIEMGIVDVATGSKEPLRLRNLNDFWSAARLSPDGQWIAYVVPTGTDRAETDLYLCDASGGREVLVSGGPGFEGFPEWSADGKRLLFISERTGLRMLWSVAVSDGRLQGEPTALGPGIVNGYVVGLAGDGSLFLTRAHSNSDLYEVDFDPATQRSIGEPRLAVPDGRGRNRKPSLSPDGERLAFARRADPGRDWTSYNVIVRETKTGLERVLPVKTSYWFPAPRWSADGKSLSVRTSVDTSVRVATVLLETGQVSMTTLEEERSPVGKRIASGEVPVPGTARFVTVSPDDRWVAYIERSSAGSGDSLYVLPASGGAPHELVHEAKDRLLRPLALLMWSSTSERLYFGAAAGAREKTEAWTIRLAGGKPHPTGIHLGEGLTFSPDGKRAAYGVSTDATNELWVIRNLPLK